MADEIPKVQQSATVQLATDIEMLTASHWTQEQRYEVAELIRKYRFQQLVRESGHAGLSEKLFFGKY